MTTKTDFFKIYLDRLKENQPLKIQHTIASDFIQISEKELSFPEPVSFSGEAYLSNGFLILHLTIETTANIPCVVCNDKINVPIKINDFYLSEKLSELKSPVFDFMDEVRSSILVKVPTYYECNNGNCPEREIIKKYLKQ